MIKYAVIGAGWRSAFYIRIAKLCPQKFRLSGVYIRDSERAERFRQTYDIPVTDNLAALLAEQPDFVVSCVNKGSIYEEAELLCRQGVAVLSETPMLIPCGSVVDPAWRVQVAEQFHFQPRHQAVKAVIDSGLLGDVHHVQLSCCHDYHAVSLIRYFLGIRDEIPKITAISRPDPVITYNSREGFGIPGKALSQQKIAILEYGDKTAIYDFTAEQYFSEIRASRIIIRGTRGEIINDRCTYLNSNTPLTFDLVRNQCGTTENLDGMYLRSITGNGSILYHNPFPGIRFSDEEIAIATCLVKMKEYLATGTPFYSLTEANIDCQTALMWQ